MKLTAALWDVAIKALDDVKGLPDEVVALFGGDLYVRHEGKRFP